VKIKTAALFRMLVAGGLGVATLEVIAHLGTSRISDGLALPGGVVGMLGSIVGLYDTPSGPWAAVCLAGNFLFYAGAWWVLLSLAVRPRHGAS